MLKFWRITILCALVASVILPTACTNLSDQENWYNSKNKPASTGQISSSGFSLSRDVSISLNADLKMKLDASLKMKLKLKSPRRFAPSGLASYSFIGINPAGQQIRHEFGSNLRGSLQVPTNASWSFFLEISETNYTNALLMSYPDDRVQVRMAPGIGGSMSEIDLGLPVISDITNPRLVSSNNPAAQICRSNDGIPDNVRDTNSRTFDNDGDGVMDCFAVIDRDQNGLPDIYEIAKTNTNTNSSAVPAYLSNTLANTNSPAMIATLAADPNMGFYKTAPVFTNATVRFALDDTLIGFRTNMAAAWSNTLVKVSLDNHFAAEVPTDFKTNWSNSVVAVALDTNYRSVMTAPAFTNLVSAWSNSVVAVALDTNYRRVMELSAFTNLAHEWSNSVVEVALDSGFQTAITNLSSSLLTAWSNTVADVVMLPAYSNIVPPIYIDVFTNTIAEVATNTNWSAAVSNFATNSAYSSAAVSSMAMSSSGAISSAAVSSVAASVAVSSMAAVSSTAVSSTAASIAVSSTGAVSSGIAVSSSGLEISGQWVLDGAYMEVISATNIYEYLIANPVSYSSNWPIVYTDYTNHFVVLIGVYNANLTNYHKADWGFTNADWVKLTYHPAEASLAAAIASPASNINSNYYMTRYIGGSSSAVSSAATSVAVSSMVAVSSPAVSSTVAVSSAGVSMAMSSSAASITVSIDGPANMAYTGYGPIRFTGRIDNFLPGTMLYSSNSLGIGMPVVYQKMSNWEIDSGGPTINTNVTFYFWASNINGMSPVVSRSIPFDMNYPSVQALFPVNGDNVPTNAQISYSMKPGSNFSFTAAGLYVNGVFSKSLPTTNLPATNLVQVNWAPGWNSFFIRVTNSMGKVFDSAVKSVYADPAATNIGTNGGTNMAFNIWLTSPMDGALMPSDFWVNGMASGYSNGYTVYASSDAQITWFNPTVTSNSWQFYISRSNAIADIWYCAVDNFGARTPTNHAVFYYDGGGSSSSYAVSSASSSAGAVPLAVTVNGVAGSNITAPRNFSLSGQIQAASSAGMQGMQSVNLYFGTNDSDVNVSNYMMYPVANWTLNFANFSAGVNRFWFLASNATSGGMSPTNYLWVSNTGNDDLIVQKLTPGNGSVMGNPTLYAYCKFLSGTFVSDMNIQLWINGLQDSNAMTYFYSGPQDISANSSAVLTSGNNSWYLILTYSNASQVPVTVSTPTNTLYYDDTPININILHPNAGAVDQPVLVEAIVTDDVHPITSVSAQLSYWAAGTGITNSFALNNVVSNYWSGWVSGLMVGTNYQFGVLASNSVGLSQYVNGPSLTANPPCVYVASNGNDANSGMSPASALRSFDKALSLAGAGGFTLKVAEGTYSAANGNFSADAYAVNLTNFNHVTVSSGWSSDFVTPQNGPTILDLANSRGGILISNSSMITLNNGLQIRYGSAQNGGGLLVWNSASVSIYDVTLISNNVSGNGGGAAVFQSPNFSFMNSYAYDNTSTYDGAGVYLTGSDNSSFNGAWFKNNVSASGAGGGLMLNNAVGVYATVHAIGNVALSGGGVAVNGCTNTTLTLDSVSNTALGLSGEGGGGLLLYNTAYLSVSGNIEANAATNIGAVVSGGGVYAYAMFNATIYASVRLNQASSNGGGWAIVNSGTNVFQNTALVEANILKHSQSAQAADFGGGGVAIINSDFNTFNNTFINNTNMNTANIGDAPGAGVWFNGINSSDNLITGQLLSNASIFLNGSIAGGGSALCLNQTGGNNRFQNGWAEGNTGSNTVYVDQAAYLEINNCYLTNTAAPLIEVSAASGAGSTLNVNNSVLVLPLGGGYGIRVYNSAANYLSVSYCTFGGETLGAGTAIFQVNDAWNGTDIRYNIFVQNRLNNLWEGSGYSISASLNYTDINTAGSVTGFDPGNYGGNTFVNW